MVEFFAILAVVNGHLSGLELSVGTTLSPSSHPHPRPSLLLINSSLLMSLAHSLTLVLANQLILSLIHSLTQPLLSIASLIHSLSPC